MIEENVKNLINKIPKQNAFGEKVTIVAAVKLQTSEDINRAIASGITDIGDNHAQEFKEKFDFISGSPIRHFIGHLQTNKIKYLLGKVDLYHSVDSLTLANELSKKSLNGSVISNILLQVNIGNESAKGGFLYENMSETYKKIAAMPNLKIKGLMAMLPISSDTLYLKCLAKKMRALYDNLNVNGEFSYLSMGMSGDFEICIEEGSNTIRLGTAIFGERHYK